MSNIIISEKGDILKKKIEQTLNTLIVVVPQKLSQKFTNIAKNCETLAARYESIIFFFINLDELDGDSTYVIQAMEPTLAFYYNGTRIGTGQPVPGHTDGTEKYIKQAIQIVNKTQMSGNNELITTMKQLLSNARNNNPKLAMQYSNNQNLLREHAMQYMNRNNDVSINNNFVQPVIQNVWKPITDALKLDNEEELSSKQICSMMRLLKKMMDLDLLNMDSPALEEENPDNVIHINEKTVAIKLPDGRYKLLTK